MDDESGESSNRLALQKIKQLLFIREEINVSRSGSNNDLLMSTHNLARLSSFLI